MTSEERLDFLEYRQELLYENTSYSRLLFEYRVSKKQHDAIMDIFDDLRSKVGAGEKVNHGAYEQRINDVVPQHYGNYHFAEFLAQENHRRGSWEEVFEELYGDAPKFQSYLEKQQSYKSLHNNSRQCIFTDGY